MPPPRIFLVAPAILSACVAFGFLSIPALTLNIPKFSWPPASLPFGFPLGFGKEVTTIFFLGSVFLGADFLKVSFLIKLISFAVLLFGVFLCLRSTIDALFDMAINSLNCFIALISFLSIYYSLTFFNVNEVYNILIPFIISLNILSIRTVLILYKYFKRLLP